MNENAECNFKKQRPERIFQRVSQFSVGPNNEKMDNYFDLSAPEIRFLIRLN